ncbi:HpcH/HpaI aldolase family protein [Mongoliimonas terrestris]|uniref:HpcH/HpaI aldolase family protein n=1 Tax=Mongoliimonas terrestris TaxID=1709001 RepID=UPI000949AD6B|nr:aldolase/citrate lyase family protein [Mongoliimonas terrestris]
MQRLAFWMTQPTIPHIEIAWDFGFRRVVLDIEHGTFDLDALDRVIPFCRALGMTVYAKVLGPQTETIQQALDFGADTVVIPHIESAAHAEAVCRAAKYPPLGTRSYSGGRPVRYGPANNSYGADQNRATRCYPMIESPGALADVEAIAALPTVDGLFVGPTDLSLTQGAQRYTFSERDQADIARCAAAAKAAGKSWILPGWTAPERALAQQHGAEVVVVGAQFYMVRSAFQALVDQLASERIA